MATGPICYLGGKPFRAGPEEIRWNYTMRTAEKKCIGGKVIQILGVNLGDLTVRGRYGSGRKGEEGDWEQQWRTRDRVKAWAREVEANRATKPLRFQYPDRNWDFMVFIKQVSPFRFTTEDFSNQWEFVLQVEEDGARALKTSIEDLYMKRLMDGVGWKQTDYNGGNAQQIADKLAGGTVGDYLASLAQEAFNSGLPGGQIGAH